MIHPEKPLCIIPARGSSKRFPRKNIALLAGKPLLAHAIQKALESEVFDQVCVSSEDDKVLDIARNHGATLALKRPSELSSDKTQVKHVCHYLLEDFRTKGMEYDEFAVLLATNPLRTARDIQAAYTLFKQKDADYVMSLVPYSHPPQRAVWAPNGYVVPYFGIEYMRQTQLLEPLYRHDGSVIFAKSEVFLKEGEFYGTKVVPFFLSADRSIDIDSPLDLLWAEVLINRDEKRESIRNEYHDSR